jgi:copper chaperone CopZ
MIKEVYRISGMHCQHCAQRLQKALISHPEVEEANVTHAPPMAMLTLKHPLLTEELQALVDKAGAYTVNQAE